MKIKSIQLTNFRQYKGQQELIKFSIDKEKNVTIILGDNTSGKTTLMQAFKWCLYKNTTFKTKEVLNEETAYSMKIGSEDEVSVEIVLIHENREYIIKRNQKFIKRENNKLSSEHSSLKIQYKEENGGQIPIEGDHQCEEIIETILHEGLSDYFFFDGEKISDINNRKDVVAAVRGLMGLDVVGAVRERLDRKKESSVPSKFNKELEIQGEDVGEKLKNSLREEKIKLEELGNRLDEVEKEIVYYKERGKDLNDKLIKNKDAGEHQKTINSIDKDIENLQKEIIQKESRIISDFQKEALKFFALPLITTTLEIIKNLKESGEGIPAMSSPAIDYILK
ncbi:MAG: AAA family ATPase, partial [Fusobacteriaceae bacterium]|nr:AAA family ATPase [Fusobacteriaceae bacterium]